MSDQNLGALRFFALLFLLPGLAGLILSAMVSTHYLDSLPRIPVPAEQRVVPRGIHGQTVYQTQEEDRRLTLMEDISVTVFLVGVGLGLVYMRKWGIEQALSAEDEELITDKRLGKL